MCAGGEHVRASFISALIRGSKMKRLRFGDADAIDDIPKMHKREECLFPPNV